MDNSLELGPSCLMLALPIIYIGLTIYFVILVTRFVRAHESIAESIGRMADRNHPDRYTEVAPHQ